MINCKFEDGLNVSLRHIVVDALIEKDNKMLFVKRAPFLPHGGKYGLPGGYLDRDELVEEGVVREVLEETGYLCKPFQFFCIIDNLKRGDDRQNVGLAYLTKLGEKKKEPDSETTELIWVDLDNLPPKELFAFDHYRIIQFYKEYKANKLKVPFSTRNLT